MSDTLEVVRRLVAEGKVRVSQHGREELADDEISLADAIAGVASAVVVEDYPDYAKGPSVLCLQEDLQGESIHVLWGVARNTPDVATIITAYRPDPARWHDDLKTRKPR